MKKVFLQGGGGIGLAGSGHLLSKSSCSFISLLVLPPESPVIHPFVLPPVLTFHCLFSLLPSGYACPNSPKTDLPKVTGDLPVGKSSDLPSVLI